MALTLLQRYPLPTSKGTANNYRRIDNEGDNQDQVDFRIDHRFSDRDQIFGRFSYANDDASPVTPLPDGSGIISSGAIARTITPSYSLASSYLHTLMLG